MRFSAHDLTCASYDYLVVHLPAIRPDCHFRRGWILSCSAAARPNSAPLAHRRRDPATGCFLPSFAQRVEYFKGSKLVDTLLGPKYKGKLAKETPIKSRAEAAKLGQELLRLGFFHRSQRVAHAHSRRWELELINGPFEEDGLYTWVYEGASAYT